MVDYLQTQNELILGLLNVNLRYILVMWKFGTEKPPTISVGGSLLNPILYAYYLRQNFILPQMTALP